jgi:UDP-glucose 4-epimerase
MKELVTGGAGFIGSRLAARLVGTGAEVHVVDDLSLGRKEQVPEGARLSVLDVCAPGFADLVREVGPDRVWHLAANSDISAGTRDLRADLERTFLTTVRVIEALRAAPIDVVFASTSAIYGPSVDDRPFDEDHGPLRPISLYGAAKLASEAYLSAACHLYALRAWIFRFPNVIGPHLTHGVVHDFVGRLRVDPTCLKVLGNGTQEKPYLHVDDLLDAMALGVKQAGEFPLVYNVAGDGMTSVRAIAEMVREELGLLSARIEYGTEARGWPGDVPRFSYDTRKIRALGWRPKVDSTAAVLSAVRDEIKRRSG